MNVYVIQIGSSLAIAKVAMGEEQARQYVKKLVRDKVLEVKELVKARWENPASCKVVAEVFSGEEGVRNQILKAVVFYRGEKSVGKTIVMECKIWRLPLLGSALGALAAQAE